jgi:hypothetical protein
VTGVQTCALPILEHNVPMAGGIIFATASELNALCTQDADFQNICNVKYFSK